MNTVINLEDKIPYSSLMSEYKKALDENRLNDAKNKHRLLRSLGVHPNTVNQYMFLKGYR